MNKPSDTQARDDESLEEFVRRLNRDFLGGGEVKLAAALERVGPPPSRVDDREDLLLSLLAEGI